MSVPSEWETLQLNDKLTSDESTELRSRLRPLLNTTEGTDEEDVNDFLEYTLAMVSNQKSVAYAVAELQGMEMDFCTKDVTIKIGEFLQGYLSSKQKDSQAQMSALPSKETKDGNSAKSRVVSLKSTGSSSGAGNALTMAGALGAARNKKDDPNQEATSKKNERSKKDRRDIRGEAFDRLATPSRDDRNGGGRRGGGGGRGQDDRRRGGRGGGRNDSSNRGGRDGRGGGPDFNRNDSSNRGGRDGRGGGRDFNNEQGQRNDRGQRRNRDEYEDHDHRAMSPPQGGRGGRGGFRGGRGHDHHRRGGGGREPFGPRGGRDFGGRGGRSPNKRQRMNDEQQHQADSYEEQQHQDSNNYDDYQDPYYYDQGYGNGGGYYDQGFRGGRGGFRGRGRGGFRGRGRGRSGRGRPYHQPGDQEGAGNEEQQPRQEQDPAGQRSGEGGVDQDTAEAAAVNPSPLVAATFRGGFRGGYRGRGRGRGRSWNPGRNHQNVQSMIASKTWVRKKEDGDSGAGAGEEGGEAPPPAEG